MLAKRIIPCLDVKDGKTVKGVCFGNLRDAGDPVELGRRYSEEGADELVFLDITASSQRRKTLVDMVSRVAREVNIPFTVGGGIGSVADVEALLNAGADKISINSSALARPELIDEIAARFGSQVCVVAIARAVSTAIGNVSLTAAAVLPDADCLSGLRRLNAEARENCCLRVWTTTV